MDTIHNAILFIYTSTMQDKQSLFPNNEAIFGGNC